MPSRLGVARRNRSCTAIGDGDAIDARVGWGLILKRTFKETVDDNCLGLSAQLAYYFFLSLFPALLVVVTLTSFLRYRRYSTTSSGGLPRSPPDVLAIVTAQIQQITKGGNTGLLTFGILGALWSSSSAMSAIIDTLNRAYGVKEARPWWKTQVLAVFLTIMLSVFMLVSLTLVLAGPEIAGHLARRVGLGPAFAWTWKIPQWPIAFRFYIANFGNFNKMYGSIGAVIVLLLWFYLSGLVLLFGAELNSEIEHASPYGKAEGENRRAAALDVSFATHDARRNAPITRSISGGIMGLLRDKYAYAIQTAKDVRMQGSADERDGKLLLPWHGRHGSRSQQDLGRHQDGSRLAQRYCWRHQVDWRSDGSARRRALRKAPTP